MRKRQESGFALLLVFLMAAVIAISLYMEIPRVAFQAQRQKEQLLISRGEQYQRAIQLFVKVNGRYPAELKDLESFNNRRFLRHKFIDPMTGKDDWRLVHINNGVLTDSVLNKQTPGNAKQQGSSTAGQYVSELPAIGSTPTDVQQNATSAVTRRRASEGGPAQAAVGPDGQPLPPGQPPQPGSALFPGQPQPGAQPYIPGQPSPGMPPNPAFPGAIPGSQPNPGAPVPPEVTSLPGTANPPGQPFFSRVPPGAQNPGAQPPGNPPNPTLSSPSYVGGNQPYVGSSQPYVGGGTYIGSQPTTASTNPAPGMPEQMNPRPNIPGVPGFAGTPNMPGVPGVPGGVQGMPGNPGGFPGNPQTAGPGFPQPGSAGANQAAAMINNLLTNPRQGPAAGQPGSQFGAQPMGQGATPGQPGSPVGGQPMGQQMGGGIAGVASKLEAPAIMVYNDRTKYNEWEFIFDYTKQKQIQNPAGGLPGTPAAAIGNSPANPGFGVPASGLAASPAAQGLGGAGFGTGGLGRPASARGPATGNSPFGIGNSPFGAGSSPFGTGSLPAGANPASGTGANANPANTAAGQQGTGLPPGFRLGRP